MLSNMLIIEELMKGHVARLNDPDYSDKDGSRRALSTLGRAWERTLLAIDGPAVRRLVAAGDFAAASDLVKDTLGLEGDHRVYIVPPGAVVTVEFGGAS